MLIIYAHPKKTGHCAEFLSQVKTQLDEKKVSYEVLDLYEMNYNPVLKPGEHYTSGGRDVDEQNKSIQVKIKNTDKFIFIYPTWWNNMPAILKGFIDRVFTAGFAFKYVNGLPLKLLKGKAVIFTSTGAPLVYTKTLANQRSLKALSRDALAFCGIKSKGFIIGNGSKFTDGQKQKISKLVKKGLDYLL